MQQKRQYTCSTQFLIGLVSVTKDRYRKAWIINRKINKLDSDAEIRYRLRGGMFVESMADKNWPALEFEGSIKILRGIAMRENEE